MSAFAFCSEFVVPHNVDVGHPARGGDRSVPNPTIEAVRATIEIDDQLTLLSIASSNPRLFVCVSVDAPDADTASTFVQKAVHDALMVVIPGATFINLEPTNPEWLAAGSAGHEHGVRPPR